MAKIVYETRTFTDNSTGAKIDYDYIAIAGTDEKSHKYEVQLKNLVQSEKMALLMIADNENTSGEVSVKKGGNVDVTKKETSGSLLDDDEKGLFD